MVPNSAEHGGLESSIPLDSRRLQHRTKRLRPLLIGVPYTPHFWINPKPTWPTHVLKYCKEVLPKLGLPKSKKVYEMHGMLDGIKTVTVPDTGAAINTINTAFAQARGYRIKSGPENCTKIKTLNGRKVLSEGIVELDWAFADSPGTKYNLVFHAVTKSPSDILLGMPFLEATETLTKNTHRVTIRKVLAESNAKNVRFQDVADSALPKARGKLNQSVESALADSGSEVNIMSLSYALRHGYTIDRSPDSQEKLRFGNGAEEQTIGRVMARWRFSGCADEHLLEFEVLKNSHFDLVLGQDVLFETEAFKNHTESIFYHIDSQEKSPGRPCCPINDVRRRSKLVRTWNQRKRKSSEDTSPEESVDIERDIELERRAKARGLIDSMSDGAAKDAARDLERQRCSAWHSRQIQQQQQPSTTRSSSQASSTMVCASSSQSSASCSSGSTT